MCALPNGTQLLEVSSDTSWAVSSKKTMGHTLIFIKSSLLKQDRLLQTKADILDKLVFLSNEPQIVRHIKELLWSIM